MFKNNSSLSRTSDPATSKVAARRITSSGARSSSKFKVLEYMKSFDLVVGLPEYRPTAYELARDSGIPHPTVHKRLPDLRADGMVVNGPVRTCTVTGRPSLTWRTSR